MDDGIEPTPRNMITRTKLFESNLQMVREIYFMKGSRNMDLGIIFGQDLKIKMRPKGSRNQDPEI